MFDCEKKTNNYNSYGTCKVFIYDNIIKFQNNNTNENKFMFLDQEKLKVEFIESNGYLKIYRENKKNLVFIKEIF